MFEGYWPNKRSRLSGGQIPQGPRTRTPGRLSLSQDSRGPVISYTVYGAQNSMKGIILGSLILLAAGMAVPGALADKQDGEYERTISVTGAATSSVEPDLLVIEFGVEIQKETAAEALRANSQAMSRAVGSVMEAGVEDGEVGTSRFSIRPVYGDYNEETGDLPLVGYRVTNTLMVRTANLDAAADIIDSGVEAGANRVDDVSFVLSPERQAEVKDAMISAAVLDARAKAEMALEPLEYVISGVKSVSLSESRGPPTPFYADAGFAMSMRESAPIFSSEQDVATTAHVVFTIEPEDS
ncbi:conserved hypothetical protein [Cenarchaeum symbiosum A]|uniref:Outer membrane protein n=1 Tax=Cenarchaeum symbiosum (strain A) TaxID=414004 RepID=A0RWP9_CENSY|nr:conserved hypothetical protein [Cenarchaeum symbiosum A]